MSATYFTKVETHEGDVVVLTKTRYLLFLSIPRTSVMPSRVGQLGRLGVQFRWTTSEPDDVEALHNSIVQALREGVGLSDLRSIADIGLKLMSLGPGVPFIPPDAPLPASLKQISSYVKRVI
jgi:hypothetical protein